MAKKIASKAKNKSAPIKNVKVKRSNDLISSLNRFVSYNLHDRYKLTLSETTKQKIVGYGPWFGLVVLFIVAPELLVLANNGAFISPNSFLEKILFSRESWALLIVVLINILCAVDSFGELFEKTRRGWNRIYFALLVNIVYVFYQFVTQLSQPAAPILSLVILVLCLFTLLDTREYYS